jgi:hypothetical protein
VVPQTWRIAGRPSISGENHRVAPAVTAPELDISPAHKQATACYADSKQSAICVNYSARLLACVECRSVMRPAILVVSFPLTNRHRSVERQGAMPNGRIGRTRNRWRTLPGPLRLTARRGDVVPNGPVVWPPDPVIAGPRRLPGRLTATGPGTRRG